MPITMAQLGEMPQIQEICAGQHQHRLQHLRQHQLHRCLLLAVEIRQLLMLEILFIGLHQQLEEQPDTHIHGPAVTDCLQQDQIHQKHTQQPE